jgi:hypothetical protein
MQIQAISGVSAADYEQFALHVANLSPVPTSTCH